MDKDKIIKALEQEIENGFHSVQTMKENAHKVAMERMGYEESMNKEDLCRHGKATYDDLVDTYIRGWNYATACGGLDGIAQRHEIQRLNAIIAGLAIGFDASAKEFAALEENAVTGYMAEILSKAADSCLSHISPEYKAIINGNSEEAKGKD